ncbi:MAG: GDSL-type esterase/lipase family protein [Chloroflexi bacterium]|nr:GDSL-type esterase/lipase family protein [Chloroflexota bacterium]MCI0580897.1 GDSL-type esterase/lipase family protein [Chloroflexota bacterium]MCI0649745.1 GDSL-type esterase/lipase family protein [Chloroflexota bacterium]MCI0725484.1 GDSL-type esterase/lipase family protein [Chloroflexota bacterium]
MKENRQKASARIGRLLLMVSIGLLLGLLVAEGLLRLLKPPILDVTEQPCVYEPDGELGFRFTANATGRMRRYFEINNVVEINSDGLYDVEHDPENTPRVVVIGDSFTASLHVPKSDSWTFLLQEQLRQSGYPSVEVFNLGLDGTGTDVHLGLLKRYLPVYRPDLVILAFYENDIGDILAGPRFRECYHGFVVAFRTEEQRNSLRAYVDNHEPSALSSWLFNHLYIVRLLSLQRGNPTLRTNYFYPSLIGLNSGDGPNDPERVNELFQELVVLSRQNGFTLVVIPVPNKEDPAESLNTLKQSVAPDILSQLNVVDVRPALDELLAAENTTYSELFWKYDLHLNATGNRLFGLVIAPLVAGYLRE